jgi:hypothetical protein
VRADAEVGDDLVRQLGSFHHRPEWVRGEVHLVSDPDDPGTVSFYTIESPALVLA